MEMTPGFLARSIAGNDKDKIYVISEDLGTYVSLLAENGRVLPVRPLRSATGHLAIHGGGCPQ